LFPAGDEEAWTAGLRALLDDPAATATLRQAAGSLELPTWAEAAGRLQAELVGVAGI
jgi:hypothetical protein